MFFERYGVKLERLTEDKIELVRNWRNDPKISQFMEFRDHITAEMQKKWFVSIDNESNYYFVINYKGQDVGLTNVKDVDFTKKTGEGGIFIYEDSLLNSDIPFRVIFSLNDFCFEELGLETMVAHIMDDNQRAIVFNLVLGYKKVPDSKGPKSTYLLNKADYLKCREKFARLFK